MGMGDDPVPAILSYAGPSAHRSARPYHILIALTSFIVFLAPTSAFCLIAPAFESVYKDIKTALPAMTRVLLHAGRWYRDGGWALAVLFCLAIPAAGVWLRSKEANDSLIKRYAFLTVIAAMLLLLCGGTFMVIAFLVPMMSIGMPVPGPGSR